MNIIRVISTVFLIICLASCSRKPADQQAATGSEEPPAYMGIASETGIIDLDAMPDTIRYANAYALVLAPEEYAGKPLKVTVPVIETVIGKKEKKKLAVTIYDATRCCLITIPIEFDKTAGQKREKLIGKTLTITGIITPIQGKMGFYLANSQIQP